MSCDHVVDISDGPCGLCETTPTPSPLPWIYETPVKLSEKGIYLGMHYQIMSYEHDWNSKDPQVLGYAKTKQDAELMTRAVNSFALVGELVEALEKVLSLFPEKSIGQKGDAVLNQAQALLTKAREAMK